MGSVLGLAVLIQVGDSVGRGTLGQGWGSGSCHTLM